MTKVDLRQIEKSFGATKVLNGVELSIDSGAFCVFVGPSGCGKSTLLRVIAGLEDASAGEVLFDGAPVTELDPAQREIAMVFQSYALYPNMNVKENLAFSLVLRKAPRAEIDAAVAKAAKMLDLEHLLARKPRELSGGQRQRVAIGRAIVRKPKVFLFDEPLSNLDAELRTRMRYELAQLHQSLGATMIYVTHDQVEAMTLADVIVVLSQGSVQQVGKPLELYENPANLFVASFLGSPQMNTLPATVAALENDGVRVALPGGGAIAAAVTPAGAKPGDAVTLGVRPEVFRLASPGEGLAAIVSHIERLGSATLAYAAYAGADEPLVVRMAQDAAIERGATLHLVVRPEDCHIFAADGRAFVRRRT